MIKSRVRAIAAGTDDDSPFRPWPAESEAAAFEQEHAAEPLEWFAATGDTEAAEEETNTKCTDSGVGIIGHDDRQPVSNTTGLPFRWICQLWIRREGPLGKFTDTGATGVLVSPRHVLTCAHAIREVKKDERGQPVSYEATQIVVTPARDGDDRPFEKYGVKLPAQIAPGWTPGGDSGAEHDYALLTLDTAVGDKTFESIGKRKLLYWGSALCPEATAVSQDPATLTRVTGITAGYPNDRGGAKTMFTTSGQLGGISATRRFMNFAADACQGQSGSPVWVFAGGKYRLVGLLVRVQLGSALVIPITRDVAARLRTWMGSASDAFAREAEQSETEDEGGTAQEESEEGETWNETIGETEHAFEFEESAPEASSEGFDAGEATYEEEELLTDEVGEESGAEGQVPSAAVTVGNLAFLTPIAAPPDPGIYDAAGKYQLDPKLQKSLAAAVKKVGVFWSPIALVDLSTNPTAPDFAGSKHTEQAYPASMAKLIPMLAAFQLRSDLQAIHTTMSGAPVADVFIEARRRWSATQTPPAGTPVVPISGDLGRQGDLVTWKGKPIALPAKSLLPNLETLFGPGPAIAFASVPLSLSRVAKGACSDCNEYVQLERIERHGKGDDRKHGFVQRQKLMIGFSNNAAANSCIVDLGFAYIASVLIQTGLWEPARGGGLWLGGGYGGLSWGARFFGGSAMSATAGALAALLTLIARGLAVDATSSAAMRALLDKDAYPSAYTRSGFKDGLDKDLARRGQSPATVYSKLGLLQGPEYDCAIIERKEGGKDLKYVAVAINVPGTPTMEKLIVELDQCIRTNNGL